MFRKFVMIALGIAMIERIEIAQAQETPEIGRFQIAIPIDNSVTAILIDTITGRSWILSGNKALSWTDLNYGKVKGGHMALTPPSCTQDNPTCYFEMPKSKQTEGTP